MLEVYNDTYYRSGTPCYQISFSVSDQVAPGVLDAQQMVEYQTLTNLRVRLVNPFANLGVNDSYVYYAIYEWSIQGTCLCNGHGECSPLEGEELVDGKVSHLGACVYNMHANEGICLHVSEDLVMSLNTSLVVMV